MKTEIKLILEKHGNGDKLATNDIRALMLYTLEILGDFEKETRKSIARAQKFIGEQFRKAA
jgi:hypothetical protein